MTPKNEMSLEAKDGAEKAAAARKPYQKPAFRFERVFETMALKCGKTGTQGKCQIIRKRS